MSSKLIVASSLLLQATGAYAAEFWAIADARGKGQDYLFVVNVEGEQPLRSPRRLRCQKSLPAYVEEMLKASERIDGKLLLRVQLKIVPEQGGERATDIKIKAVVLMPESSWPLLAELKSWKEYSGALKEEPEIPDPFREKLSDPFDE